MSTTVNALAARRLEEVASLLHEQGAKAYRVQAYRRAAATLLRLQRSVGEILRDEGFDGLCRLPAVSSNIARSIATLVTTGRLPMLDRLRGETDTEAVLRSVPGIGPTLARRLHQDLGIDSLEDLEAAAHDGRLARLAGLGEKRVAGIIDTLAGRLRRLPTGGPPPATPEAPRPAIAELLDVDREYRDRALQGELARIAPRRFNPAAEAWLPVLHTHRGDRHYTALFSNTARAHRLGKTSDWVVLYFDGPGGEGQCTVITAEWGPLAGHRIIRGRERECGSSIREPRSTQAPEQPMLLRAG